MVARIHQLVVFRHLEGRDGTVNQTENVQPKDDRLGLEWVHWEIYNDPKIESEKKSVIAHNALHNAWGQQ